MSGSELYQDPDERIREVEQRDQEIERKEEPQQERGQREGPHEPDASGDEEGEDNDGGPPSSRR